MVGEIVLEQIWHLRHVGDTEDRWLFSVNYKVPLESSTVRNFLQGETDPPISIVEHVDLLDRSRVLVTEIRGHCGQRRRRRARRYQTHLTKPKHRRSQRRTETSRPEASNQNLKGYVSGCGVFCGSDGVRVVG